MSPRKKLARYRLLAKKSRFLRFLRFLGLFRTELKWGQPQRLKFSFENLEERRLLADCSSATFEFSPPGLGSENDVVLVDSFTPGQTRISGTSGGALFEPLFVSNHLRLAIQTGSGDDMVDLSNFYPSQCTDISVDLGHGEDTLLGLEENTTWNVTGANSGALTGNIQFRDVEQLVGTEDNEDTFVFQIGGSISGMIDGGAGGFDSLVVEGRRNSIFSVPTGPHSGDLIVDDVRIRYDGLEPITVNSASVTFMGTDGDDSINVAAGGAGILISSPSIESMTFAATGVTTLLIDGASGKDTVTFTGTVDLVATNLTVKAENIKVESGANLSTSGSITLEATEQNKPKTPVATFTSTTTNVTIDNATLKGGVVRITSLADSANLFGEGSTASEKTLDSLGGLSVLGGVAKSTAKAEIQIMGNSKIEATSLVLDANAKTDASVKTVTQYLGVAVGLSEPTATLFVDAGTSITTTGDVSFNSSANSKLSVLAAQGLLGPSKSGEKINITFAYGETDIISKTQIAKGATVTAGGSFSVNATSTKDNEVSASAGAYEDGSVGTGVAISLLDSKVDALVDGTVHAAGDVSIKADSSTSQNDTNAAAEVGSGFAQKKIVFPLKDKLGLSKMTDFFNKKVPGTDSRSGAPTKLAFSAAFAYADQDTSVNARIGDGAEVISQGGSVLVTAMNMESPSIIAKSAVNTQRLDETKAAGTPGNTKENSISAAVAVGDYTTIADAYIGKNAVVEASGDISVRAEARIPYEIQWTQINSPSDILNKLNGNLGLQNGFFTSWSQSGAKGTKTALAGSVNFLELTNKATSHVEENAKITSSGALKVQANTEIDAVHLSGVFGLTFFGTESANGVGGAYLQVDYNNTTQALIKNGVEVNSGALMVKADTNNRNISIAESGGKASNFGANGSFSLLTVDNQTLAQVDDGAKVTTGTSNLVLQKDVRDLFSPTRDISFSTTRIANNQISFLTPHYLTEGLRVTYRNNGNASLANLVDGKDYFVHVIDEFKIELKEIVLVPVPPVGSIEISGPTVNLSGSTGTGEIHDLSWSVGNALLFASQGSLSKQIEHIPLSLDSNGDGKIDTSDENILSTSSTGYTLKINQFVSAEDGSQLFNIGGGFVKGSSTGIGFSGAINEITRDTKSLVGNQRSIVKQSDLSGIDGSGTVHTGYNHGFVNGDAVVYSDGGGSSIGGLTNGDVYFVNRIDNQSFTLARTALEASKSFAPSTAVNARAGAEVIDLGYVHGFKTGDAVTYDAHGDTPIGGLVSGASYIVIALDATHIALTDSSDNAFAEAQVVFDPHSTIVDNRIRFPVDHAFINGQKLLYQNAGGASIGGLTSGSFYYVKVIDASTIQLAATTALTPLTLDPTVATGALHQLHPAFNPASAVNNAANTIDLGYEHGFTTGQSIVYETHGGSVLSNLADGQVYYAIVVDLTNIALTNSADNAEKGAPRFFAPATAVASDGTIDLGISHGFVDGDAVLYSPGTGTGIGSLQQAVRYFIIRVDDTQIRLASTLGGAAITNLNPSIATGSYHSLTGDVRIDLNNASTTGDAHTIRPNVRVDLDTTVATNAGHTLRLAVDSSAAAGFTHAFGRSFNPSTVIANDTINLGYTHGFTTGQKVVYGKGGGVSIGGLSDGQSYFVIVVDTTRIQLADNPSDASAGKPLALDASEARGTQHGLGAAITPFQIVDAALDTINLGRIHGMATGQALVYRSEGGTSIGGLQDGNTYYVVVVDASTFQLAQTLANATASTPVVINLDPSTATASNHSFGDPEDGTDFHDGFGALSSGGQVAVKAIAQGTIYAITVAGSVVTNPEPKVAAPLELDTAKRDNGRPRGGINKGQAPAEAGEWGVAISGSFSLNTISDTTNAIVRDASIQQATKLDVSAKTDDNIFALGGVVALVKKDASADDRAAGIGGAVTINDIDNNTHAFTEKSLFSVSGPVSVNADTTGDIRSTVLSFSGAMGRKAGVAIAGSVSLNSISNEVEAFLVGSQSNSDSLAVLAKDNSTIEADAGGVAMSLSTDGKSLAVGAGIALNDITRNTVIAYVDQSGVDLNGRTNPNALQINAISSPDITSRSFAGALSVSMSDLSGAIAVAVTLNNIQDSEVEASIRNNSTVVSFGSGNFTLEANDDSKINADAGGVAVALAKGDGTTPAGSVGAAVSNNAISKTVQTFIDGSLVQSQGELNLNATSTAVIDVLALGGSIAGAYSSRGTAGAISLGGALALNNISSTVESSIQNGQNIFGADVISLKAVDSSTINAQAIGFSGSLAGASSGNAGSLAIGVAIGRNRIENTVRAFIADSSVSSAGLVKLYSESRSIITARSTAVSFALAASSTTAISLSGGGAESTNVVLPSTHSFIESSFVRSSGDLDLNAKDTSTITARVLAAAMTATAGQNAAGVAIGASLSTNLVGYDAIFGGSLGPTASNTDVAGQLQAYIKNSKIEVTGDLNLTSQATSSIDAGVDAIAVGIVGAIGGSALQLSGAGVRTENKIRNKIRAFIDGTHDSSDTDEGTISSRNVTMNASDDSQIKARALSAAVSASFASGNALGGSIGVSLARNEVNNSVEASISSETVTTSGAIAILANEKAVIDASATAASVSVAASSNNAIGIAGGGAHAVNVIGTNTKAFVLNSTISSGGAIHVNARNSASIKANVVAVAGSVGIGSGVGAAAAIGASLADNFIGYDENSTRTAAETLAYIQDSSIVQGGTLTVNAESTQAIKATVFAGSVAVAASGGVGFAASGAGVNAINRIGADTKAYIDGSGSEGISVGNIVVLAKDNSTIDADAGAAAVAIAIGGSAAVAVSVGVALATNTIDNRVAAYIDDANKITTSVGGISISAIEESRIQARTAAASAAAAIGVGGAAAVAITTAENIVTGTVDAYIHESTSITSAMSVTVSAADTSTIDATIAAFAASAGAISLAVGVTLANNEIGNSVSAYVSNSSVTANGGNISITAASTPSITTTNVVGAVSFGIGVSGAGGYSRSLIHGTTETYVSESSLIAPNRTVTLSSNSTSNASPTITGLSGGLAAVAAMVSETTVEGITRSYIDGKTSVQASRMDVRATDSSTVDPQTLVVGVGAITGVGAKSTGTTRRTTEAFVASASELTFGTTVLDILATSTSASKGKAGGSAGGGIAVAILDVESNVRSITRAYIGDSTGIAAGQLNLKSDATSSAIAPSEVAGIGLLAGAGIELNAVDSSLSEAFIGAATTTQSVTPTSITITGGGVDVDAKMNSTAEAKTKVTSIGLIGVAGSVTRSESQPIVRTYLGGKAKITAESGSVTFDADSTTKASTIGSELAAGAIAISFTKVSAIVKPNVSSFTESGGTIDANAASFISKSTTNLDSKINANSGGAIAVSGMTSTGELTNRNMAAIGAGTTITTVGDFLLRASSNNTGKSEASNGSGGVVAVNRATAKLTVDDQSIANMGARASIEAAGNLVIETLVTTDANSESIVKNGGFVASPDSDAVSKVTIVAKTDLKEEINLSGENVTIRSQVTKLDARATGYASVGAVVPIARGLATVDANATASVHFAAMRDTDSITARQTLLIVTAHPDLSTNADATADADGFAGSVSAKANNTQKSTSTITADSNTRLAGQSVLVQANTDNQPVIISEYHSPGFVLLEGGSNEENSTLDLTRKIIFPAKVRMLGAAGPQLKIDADGKIVVKKNLTLNNNTMNLGDTYSSGEIVVDDIRNDNSLAGGRIEFSISPTSYDVSKPSWVTTTALIQGQPEFVFVTGFDRAAFENNSNRSIRFNNINVLNPSSQFASNIFVNVADKTAFTPVVKGSIPGDTKLNITNLGNGDILLNGKIDNPFGTSVILNALRPEVVIQNGTGSIIASSTLNLTAPNGRIGSASAPIKTQSPAVMVLNATTPGNIYVDHLSGNLGVGAVSVSSNSSLVNLKSAQSILRGDTSIVPNIAATRIILNAGNGSIGTVVNPIDIETHGTASSLRATAFGDIALTESAFNTTGTTVNQSLSIDQILSNNGNIQIGVRDAETNGQDIFLSGSSFVQATLGSVTLNAGDNLQLDPNASIRGKTQVVLRVDFGDDAGETDNLPATILLQGRILAPSLSIETGADADEISIRRLEIGTVANISTGGGSDIVQIGSNATPTTVTSQRSNRGGVLNTIGAQVNVNGGAGDDDQVYLDDSGDTLDNVGTITSNGVNGFGLTVGFGYTNLDKLIVSLGSGNDVVKVAGTQSEVRTTIHGGPGADTFSVGNSLNQVNDIGGLLEIIGDTGNDILNVNDNGDTVANSGRLTANSVNGLGMGDSDQTAINLSRGIAYQGLERLNVFLGMGADRFTVSASGTEHDHRCGRRRRCVGDRRCVEQHRSADPDDWRWRAQ
jgi:hypothetical protein